MHSTSWINSTIIGTAVHNWLIIFTSHLYNIWRFIYSTVREFYVETLIFICGTSLLLTLFSIFYKKIYSWRKPKVFGLAFIQFALVSIKTLLIMNITIYFTGDGRKLHSPMGLQEIISFISMVFATAIAFVTPFLFPYILIERALGKEKSKMN